ncbi:hypothetical protein [Streptomyces sp. ST2-7A]|uniref:hypothetical protein n=1 Tax=Streptomyces sp. ST2-7A TaxID=2907214 RepID=UPI0035AC08D6
MRTVKTVHRTVRDAAEHRPERSVPAPTTTGARGRTLLAGPRGHLTPVEDDTRTGRPDPAAETDPPPSPTTPATPAESTAPTDADGPGGRGRPAPLSLVGTEARDARTPGDTGDDPTPVESRVACPECGQRIALPPGPGLLPVHALCPTPWNPFGLTVCRGTGRPVPEGLDDPAEGVDALVEALPTALPEGLDWRLRPFSHQGGPGTRPMRVPAIRRAA